jgi:hypothetical protein
MAFIRHFLCFSRQWKNITYGYSGRSFLLSGPGSPAPTAQFLSLQKKHAYILFVTRF